MTSHNSNFAFGTFLRCGLRSSTPYVDIRLTPVLGRAVNCTQMRNFCFKRESGFTLIEMLIYTALFTIIMTGTLVVAYQIIESGQKVRARVMAEEEANFVLQKIAWAVNSASAIHAPAPGASDAFLSVARAGLSVSDNPLLFDVDSGVMRIRRGSAVPKPISGSEVTISNFTVEHIAPLFGRPAGVRVTFQINGNEYEFVSYLHK